MPKIVVLLKQTFDTEEKIIVTSEGVDEREAKFVINPYDEYALEEALRLKERLGGEIIVVACGPERVQEALRTALAVGADEAIRLDWSGLPEDGSATAAALAALIGPLSPDLVLAGLFAVDTGSGSVALQVAERLGLPHVSAAVKLAVGSAGELGAEAIEGATAYALVERDVEGDTETVSVPLPALITAQQGLNEPRYPSLPGIMKAKRKPLKTVAASDLKLDGLGAAGIGAKGGTGSGYSDENGPKGGDGANYGDAHSSKSGGGSSHGDSSGSKGGDASGYGDAHSSKSGGGSGHGDSSGSRGGDASGYGDAHSSKSGGGSGHGDSSGSRGRDASGYGDAHSSKSGGGSGHGDSSGSKGGDASGGASLSADGLAATVRTLRTGLYPPPPRAAGKRLPGTAQEQAAALVQLLRDEAKVL